MNRIKMPTNVFGFPMPVTVVGAVVDGKPNYLAVAWVMRVNMEPDLIAASLGKKHHTNVGIREHREFSVCVPGAELVKEVDYVGLVSGKRTDKSEVFRTFYGGLAHAPLIEECPLVMACRLVQIVDLPNDEIVVGEIAEAYADERVLTDGKPDLRKVNPFVLSMPDNRYWTVGEPLAKAWSCGKALKEA